MTKEILIEKAKAMAAAPSCCAGLKAKVAAYLDALGTADEKVAAQNLIAEIKEDITPIDGLVAFAHSEHAKKFSVWKAQKNSPLMPTNLKQAARNIATAEHASPPSKFSTIKKFCSRKNFQR